MRPLRYMRYALHNPYYRGIRKAVPARTVRLMMRTVSISTTYTIGTSGTAHLLGTTPTAGITVATRENLPASLHNHHSRHSRHIHPIVERQNKRNNPSQVLIVSIVMILAGAEHQHHQAQPRQGSKTTQPAETEQPAEPGGSSIWHCAGQEGSDAAPAQRLFTRSKRPGVRDFRRPGGFDAVNRTVRVEQGD